MLVKNNDLGIKRNNLEAVRMFSIQYYAPLLSNNFFGLTEEPSRVMVICTNYLNKQLKMISINIHCSSCGTDQFCFCSDMLAVYALHIFIRNVWKARKLFQSCRYMQQIQD